MLKISLIIHLRSNTFIIGATVQTLCTSFGHVTDLLEALSHVDDSTIHTRIGILDNHSSEHRHTASEACFLHQNNHIHFI